MRTSCKAGGRRSVPAEWGNDRISRRMAAIATCLVRRLLFSFKAAQAYERFTPFRSHLTFDVLSHLPHILSHFVLYQGPACREVSVVSFVGIVPSDILHTLLMCPSHREESLGLRAAASRTDDDDVNRAMTGLYCYFIVYSIQAAVDLQQSIEVVQNQWRLTEASDRDNGNRPPRVDNSRTRSSEADPVIYITHLWAQDGRYRRRSLAKSTQVGEKFDFSTLTDPH